MVTIYLSKGNEAYTMSFQSKKLVSQLELLQHRKTITNTFSAQFNNT